MSEEESKRIGTSAKQCVEEGIPDANGTYYFVGTITHVMFCTPSSKLSNGFYNICKFKTTTPLPYLGLNPYTKDMEGTILGDTIEFIPSVSYKFKATLVLNEKRNEYQYHIKSVVELETQSQDKLDTYLKFVVTEAQYREIKKVCPDLVEKMFEDENYRLPDKLKRQTDASMYNMYRNILTYKDYVDLIVTFSRFPDISLSTIVAMSGLANNPRLILDQIKENPYILTKLTGFGWKRVDKLALTLTPDMVSSTPRLIAFCQYILEDIANASDGGHTWIYINNPNDVKHSMAHLIKDNVPECLPYVKDYFQQERDLTNTLGCGSVFYVDNERIGLAKYYRAEKNILRHLNDIKSGEHPKPTYTVEDAVERTNKYMSDQAGEPLSLTEEQINVIKASLDNDVIILTAHAGAGKSTAIKGIVELWRDKRIACCALAAKAAIRIKETTNRESYTIHRLLAFSQGRFTYNEENPLPYDIIVVDECSMINVSLFLSLVRAVPKNGKLILVFDDAQLPAIGAGSVAKDLLTSNFCIKRLTKIHRQAAKSGIKLDANNIRQQIDVFTMNNDYDNSGKLPLHISHGENKDMHYFNLLNAEGIHTQSMLLYKELISGGGVGGEKPIPVEDISIIVPMKSNMVNCTDSFNQEIQELLLADEDRCIRSGTYADKDKSERIFKLGARVIRKKNDYEKQVFNGEIGTIIDISDNAADFLVKFDNDSRVVKFTSKELANFELAYALTVHSMQGSENKVIIFVMDTRHTILLDSTLFYTAVTRAKDMNFVVFQTNAYITAYTTDKVLSRQTFLPLLINNVIDSDKDGAPEEKDEIGGDLF